MKMVFWGLFAAGFVACSTIGIGKTLERAGGSWTSWPMLAGIVIGAAILTLAVAFAAGYRTGPLTSEWAYVAALGGLIGLKVVVSLVHAASATAVRG